MASSLFRQVAARLTGQVTWLTLTSSPTASAFRCLHRLSAASHTLLTSTRGGALQNTSAESLAQHGPSLLGQCQHIYCVTPSAGMKTKTALRRRCKDCFFVRRRGHLFVFCKTNPRHKQRQG